MKKISTNEINMVSGGHGCNCVCHVKHDVELGTQKWVASYNEDLGLADNSLNCIDSCERLEKIGFKRVPEGYKYSNMQVTLKSCYPYKQ